jgi:hypothetical protein
VKHNRFPTDDDNRTDRVHSFADLPKQISVLGDFDYLILASGTSQHEGAIYGWSGSRFLQLQKVTGVENARD